MSFQGRQRTESKTPKMEWLDLRVITEQGFLRIVPASSKRRVHIFGGSWWWVDASWARAVRLDPLFRVCGWNVARLSLLLAVNERTFARAVVDSMGINPKNWLRRQRILASCELLREIGKVDPVARELGFKFSADFASEFRQLIGVTPSEFLRSEKSRMFGVNPHS